MTDYIREAVENHWGKPCPERSDEGDKYCPVCLAWAQVNAYEAQASEITRLRAALTARDERMKAEGAREAQAKIARLTEALTPSGDTKAAYMSEFEFIVFGMNDDGEECSHKITVPWTAIKEIMAAIKARAALQENADE